MARSNFSYEKRRKELEKKKKKEAKRLAKAERKAAIAAGEEVVEPIITVDKFGNVTETWPEVDALGRHLRYVQRMKWWAKDEQEPASWMELADSQGCPLRPGPYAIALMAHRCQVEFGPVRIESLDSVQVDFPLSGAE